MRVIPASLHQVLDFVTIAVFAFAPTVLGLADVAAILAYLLAFVHLAMTLLTRFTPMGRRPLSLALHGAVESIVGVALIALPWLLGWDGTARTFYVIVGAVILAVWALSHYRVTGSRAAA